MPDAPATLVADVDSPTFITEPLAPPRAKDLALTVQDAAVVDAAVLYLNDAARHSGVALALTVSDYVTTAFFGGDPALVSTKARGKAVSFEALCRRPDLEMSAATLRRLVRIGHQVRAIPEDVATRMSLGQHRALLPVADPVKRTTLAAQAVAEAWTAERLEAEVAARKPERANKPGRKAVHPLVKQVAVVQRAVEGLKAVSAEGLAPTELENVEMVIAGIVAALSGLGLAGLGTKR